MGGLRRSRSKIGVEDGAGPGSKSLVAGPHIGPLLTVRLFPDSAHPCLSRVSPHHNSFSCADLMRPAVRLDDSVYLVFSLSLRAPEFELCITHVVFYISPYSNSIPFRRKSSLGTILFLDALFERCVQFNRSPRACPHGRVFAHYICIFLVSRPAFFRTLIVQIPIITSSYAPGHEPSLRIPNTNLASSASSSCAADIIHTHPTLHGTATLFCTIHLPRALATRLARVFTFPVLSGLRLWGLPLFRAAEITIGADDCVRLLAMYLLFWTRVFSGTRRRHLSAPIG